MSDPSTQPGKNRRGCAFYALVLGSAFLLLIFLGIAAGYYSVQKAVDRLTEQTPVALPKPEATPAEAAAVRQRIDGFKETVRARLPSPPLMLTDREINALIAYDPEFRGLKDSVRVDIKDGKLRGQLSLPLDRLGLEMVKGRYLNGTGTFRIKIDEGRLNVALDEVEVHGKPLPRRWMSRLRGINLAQNLNEDPHASTAIGTLESVQVSTNKLILVPKPPGT